MIWVSSSSSLAGPGNLRRFYPNLVADNLSQQGIPAGTTLDLPRIQKRGFRTPVTWPACSKTHPLPAPEVGQKAATAGARRGAGWFPTPCWGCTDLRTVKEALEARLRRLVRNPQPAHPLPGRLYISVGGHHTAWRPGATAWGAGRRQRRQPHHHRLHRKRLPPPCHRFDHYLLATGGILGSSLPFRLQGQIRSRF